MAINIYSGSTPNSNNKSSPNSPKNTSRVQQLKESMVPASSVSSEGTVAVKKKGILGKIGDLAKKALPIAAKFIPGVGGAVSNVLANAFNDPEWWQEVPGDGITMNVPLQTGISLGLAPTGTDINLGQNRFTHLEITSLNPESDDTTYDPLQFFNPTDQMITQYLMPEIRKVVNAIPLQSAEAYTKALANAAFAYALWRQLKKVDYFVKHGATYLPSYNDVAFPICQVANAAWLQSTISRLEEFLRSSIRIPHTLCEYLSWRFGRIYRINQSAKGALVFYSVIPMYGSIAMYNHYVQEITKYQAATVEIQQANTDLYNAYFDHDMAVDIKDETQMKYDQKEFALRTNLDFGATWHSPLNPVLIDSDLDNPTTFMASTVSTRTDTAPLFPVEIGVAVAYSTNSNWTEGMHTGGDPTSASNYVTYLENLNLSTVFVARWITPSPINRPSDAPYNAFITATVCKALELYNAQQYVVVGGTERDGKRLIDVTALSMDLGIVTDEVLKNEQVYAFANLIDVRRKSSLSYAKAEAIVAKDVANTIATTDVTMAG